MTRPCIRCPIAVTVAASTVLALTGCAVSNPYVRTASTPRTTTPPRANGLTAAQINRQDREPPRLRRQQRAARANRPMLAALPISSGGVTVTIAGLEADATTTVLQVNRGRHDRARALQIYRRELQRHNDSGNAYRVRVRP